MAGYLKTSEKWMVVDGQEETKFLILRKKPKEEKLRITIYESEDNNLTTTSWQVLFPEHLLP
ncbi:MAG: hypothetical protein NTW49_00830 [Bacteroidia bacterium]|nr:hypothetical protein [Bacteroidia bacterium]